jgi:hypothetical protein
MPSWSGSQRGACENGCQNTPPAPDGTIYCEGQVTFGAVPKIGVTVFAMKQGGGVIYSAVAALSDPIPEGQPGLGMLKSTSRVRSAARPK